IDIPHYIDLASDDGLKTATDFVAPRIFNVLKRLPCFEHPRIPIVTKGDLAELERSIKEGGQLLLLPSSTAVVVNSAQPLELDDPAFGSTVLRNLRFGAQYEYYYGAFSDNK